MESGLSKFQIIAQLSRSPHGNLKDYLVVGQFAAADDPYFFAHLIAWNQLKGQIRDAKVALPVVALSQVDNDKSGCESSFEENALAHLALQGPRELERAYRFALEIRIPGWMRTLRRLIAAYLRELEHDKGFSKVMVQHRHTLKSLYAIIHAKPGSFARRILFEQERPQGSVFQTISQLHNMGPEEAAGAIIGRHIPFHTAMRAMGAKLKNPDVVLAVIEQMSSTQLVTNAKLLNKLGVKSNPVLRAAYDEALGRAGTKSDNLLKTTKAVEAAEAEGDEASAAKLRQLQRKQIAHSRGIEGNWLILADRSPSMKQSLDIARELAGTLSVLCKGKLWLIFFDAAPMTVDITGLSLDQIKKATAHIRANGSGTSIGCGLQRMMDEKIGIDGIAIVSDGGENSAPYFNRVYQEYSKKFDKQVPVYFYQVNGDPPALITSCQNLGIDLQIHDLRDVRPDSYSIPNLAQTMRANRYGLLDEINDAPLLTLRDVLPKFGGEVINRDQTNSGVEAQARQTT